MTKTHHISQSSHRQDTVALQRLVESRSLSCYGMNSLWHCFQAFDRSSPLIHEVTVNSQPGLLRQEHLCPAQTHHTFHKDCNLQMQRTSSSSSPRFVELWYLIGQGIIVALFSTSTRLVVLLEISKSSSHSETWCFENNRFWGVHFLT